MGSNLLYISIAYYMQKGGGWVQIACKIAYVLNGRPLEYKWKKMAKILLKLFCYCPMLLTWTTKTAVCLQTKSIFHHI